MKKFLFLIFTLASIVTYSQDKPDVIKGFAVNNNPINRFGNDTITAFKIVNKNFISNLAKYKYIPELKNKILCKPKLEI